MEIINSNIPCNDDPAKIEDHLKYPTLRDIVTAMKQDKFKPNLQEHPAFKRLEELAENEREVGYIPDNADLDAIISKLEPEGYESIATSLTCLPAFKSLKYIAERHTRLRVNDE